MCGAHYAIFQLFASRRDIVLPHLEKFREYLRSCLCVSPARRAAMHLVKLLPTVLLNGCVEHTTQVLEQHNFNPGPELGFVRACEDANLQRAHSRLNDVTKPSFCSKVLRPRSCGHLLGHFSHMYGLPQLFSHMMGCWFHLNHHLLILMHVCMGLLLPLALSSPPRFRVRAANLVHDCSRRQRSISNHVEVRAQVAHLPSRPKAPKPRLKHCMLSGAAAPAHNVNKHVAGLHPDFDLCTVRLSASPAFRCLNPTGPIFHGQTIVALTLCLGCP